MTESKDKKSLETLSVKWIPQLISSDALAKRLELTPKAVRELPLPRIRVGRRSIRYRISDVEKFLANREVRGIAS